MKSWNLEDNTKNSELDDFDDKVEAEVRLAGSHVVGTRTPLMMHDHDQTSNMEQKFTRFLPTISITFP